MSVPQIALDAVAHYLGKPDPPRLAVAVGVVSVFYAGESGLKPGAQGVQKTETPGALNPAGAYGIASWNGPRQQSLADYAKRFGLPVEDVNTQLDFVAWEMATSYPKCWAAWHDPATTYESMCRVVVEDYERPAKPEDEIARSVAFADQLYPACAALQPAPAPVPTPAPTPVAVTVQPVQTPAPVAPVAVPAPVGSVATVTLTITWSVDPTQLMAALASFAAR